jgi:hypothetical protein
VVPVAVALVAVYPANASALAVHDNVQVRDAIGRRPPQARELGDKIEDVVWVMGRGWKERIKLSCVSFKFRADS